jgi:hypothetical protein
MTDVPLPPSELFQALVEQSPDAIVFADRGGIVRLWNAAAEAVFGFSAAEIVGKPLDAIIPEHLREAHWRGYFRALAEGATKYQRHPLTTISLCKGGGRRYIDLAFSIVKNGAEVAGALAVARDVTSRRRAERQRRGDTLEPAFISVDLEWRATFVSAAAERMLGADDLLGAILWDRFPSARGTPIEEAFVRAMAEEDAVHLDTFFAPFGGWVEVHAYPSPVGLAVYLHNVNERKELEEKLRTTEESFALLAQQAVDYAIVLMDPRGVVTSWNEGAERMYGYRSEQIVGRHCGAFFPEDEARAGRADAILERARAEGRFEEEAWRVRMDGTRFWADVVLTPLVDAHGRERAFGSITRDMTERKAAEDLVRRSATRVRRLVSSNIVGVMLGDFDGRVLEANDALLALLGYSEEDLRDGRIDRARITPAEWRDADREALEEARAHGVARVRERPYVRKDGGIVHALVGTASLEDEHGGYVAFILDISDRKQLKLDRARLLAEAEAAVRTRDEFLSIASHELRTPLAALHLQLQRLARNARRRAGAAGAVELGKELDLVGSCVRQSERLSHLLDDLLDLTRIRLGRLQLTLEDVDLGELARDVVERLGPTAARAGSTLELACPEERVVGRWDRLRLDQVVTNLVSNAIKYGRGRPIAVRVRRAASAGAELDVEDGGLGVAPEMQERIFDRFERAHSGEIAGLGLGLYIARQIVVAHGGHIRVKSALGEGSTFTVELPAQR